MKPFVRDVNGMPCLFLSEEDYAKRVGDCSCGSKDVLLDTRGFCLTCRGFDQAERLKA